LNIAGRVDDVSLDLVAGSCEYRAIKDLGQRTTIGVSDGERTSWLNDQGANSHTNVISILAYDNDRVSGKWTAILARSDAFLFVLTFVTKTALVAESDDINWSTSGAAAFGKHDVHAGEASRSVALNLCIHLTSNSTWEKRWRT
jgi:hypothetical protein